MGAAIETVRHEYDASTGRETATQHLDSSGTAVLRQIERTYDNQGRISVYQDSNTQGRGKRVTTYDALGRVSQETEYTYTQQVGQRTYTYDSVTGDLTRLRDSGIDSGNDVLAAYNPDGQVTSVSYPGGLKKWLSYEGDGAASSVTYSNTLHCSPSCTWYADDVERDAHGRIVLDDSTFTDRAYAYDDLGRLSSVTDTPTGDACTTRTYTYDANSNRLSRRTNTAANPGAGCPASGSGGSVVTSTYDDSDRLLTVDGHGMGAGSVTYDAWGRITSLPGQANGGGDDISLSSYFVNDLARRYIVGSSNVLNTLDPMDRVRTRRTSVSGTAHLDTYLYGDDSNAPMFIRKSTTSDAGTMTYGERFIADPTGDLAVINTTNGDRLLQINNVRGDTVAQVDLSATAAPAAGPLVDEFGVPTGNQPPGKRYGFLGSKKRESLLNGALISMGVRTYLPDTGRFAQTDPVLGGSANTYDYANQDPINTYDLDGASPWKLIGKQLYQALKGKKGKGNSKVAKSERRHLRQLTKLGDIFSSKSVYLGLTKLAYSRAGKYVKAAVEWAGRTRAGQRVIGVLRNMYPDGGKWFGGEIRLGRGYIPDKPGPRFRLTWAPNTPSGMNAMNNHFQRTKIDVRSNMHWDLGPW